MWKYRILVAPIQWFFYYQGIIISQFLMKEFWPYSSLSKDPCTHWFKYFSFFRLVLLLVVGYILLINFVHNVCLYWVSYMMLAKSCKQIITSKISKMIKLGYLTASFHSKGEQILDNWIYQPLDLKTRFKDQCSVCRVHTAHI